MSFYKTVKISNEYFYNKPSFGNISKARYVARSCMFQKTTSFEKFLNTSNLQFNQILNNKKVLFDIFNFFKLKSYEEDIYPLSYINKHNNNIVKLFLSCTNQDGKIDSQALKSAYKFFDDGGTFIKPFKKALIYTYEAISSCLNFINVSGDAFDNFMGKLEETIPEEMNYDKRYYDLENISKIIDACKDNNGNHQGLTELARKLHRTNLYKCSDVINLIKFCKKEDGTINKENFDYINTIQKKYKRNSLLNYFIDCEGNFDILSHQQVMCFYNKNNCFLNQSREFFKFLNSSRKKLNLKSTLIQNKTINEKKFFIDYIKECNINDKAFMDFLYIISSDSKTSNVMTKAFTENPRMQYKIKEMLLRKLGIEKDKEQAEKMFYTWYNDEKDGYKAAYKNYYQEEIWDKAEQLIDLVRFSPNIAPWAFTEKAKQLNTEPVLGDLPKDFYNINTFRKFIYAIKTKSIIKKQTKNDNKNISFDIKLKDKKYNIKPFTNGMSSKYVFEITEESSKKSYIIKFPKFLKNENNAENRKFNQNQALRADMPYSDALIDFYLKENDCQNAADILFFDYNTQTSVYNKTKGYLPNENDLKFENLYNFRQNYNFLDIYLLGININDIHAYNFLIDKNGIHKLIDSGHATFSNIFRPMIIGKHFSLGNLCGRE